MKKKRSNTSGALNGLVAIGILTFFDQLAKFWAKTNLADTPGIAVIPGVFELYYLENRGAAFGMLANRQWLFVLIAAVMMLAVCYVYLKLPYTAHYRPLRIVCILIAAGALGNMIDRILWKFVIDFLYVSLIDFPVFNIADCYVCIGAAAAIILIFTRYRDDPFDVLSFQKSKTDETN